MLGAVSSRPVEAPGAAAVLLGRPLTDDLIAQAAELAAKPAKPMDNTDFNLLWRKRVTRDFVTYALRELRGDDMREARWKISRQCDFNATKSGSESVAAVRGRGALYDG